MNIQTTKQIRIEDYLHALGHSPVRQCGASLWYRSPLREETDASFKVNTALNKWFDFGIGKGGDLIALASELYGSKNVSYLLRQIGRQALHVCPVTCPFPKREKPKPAFQDVEVKELASPALYRYLKERGIDAGTARRECREIRYGLGGKRYFAVGFPNMNGGYEIRNRYFKACISPKAVSYIWEPEGKRPVCCLHEGFMDYLSFLTLQKKGIEGFQSGCDHIVLNSVANLAKALPLLDDYAEIHCFLDNDRAGKDALKNLRETYGERVEDKSLKYSTWKDLNDYLKSLL